MTTRLPALGPRSPVNIAAVLTLLCVLFSGGAADVSYSFRTPVQWGTLPLSDAGCCRRSHYPTNESSLRLGLPAFLGLGVQKGGSTSLSSYMARHPAYAMSRPKETHFWDKAQMRSSVRQYQNVWRKHGNETILRFDFTPSYLWVPFAACRVKALFPRMKFLVILRDPAKRAYSEFNMVRTRCKGPHLVCGWKFADFLKMANLGITNLQQRKCAFNDGEGRKNWNDCFQCLLYDRHFRLHCHYRPYFLNMKEKRTCLHFGAQMVSRGLYAAQLAWWFELFNPQNFLILNSNSFFGDPVKELEKVNAFFGVEQPFEQWMTKSQGMKGNYHRFNDPHLDEALEVLKEFYAKPNHELYRLLREVGAAPFAMFENQTTDVEKPELPEAPLAPLVSQELEAELEEPPETTADNDNDLERHQGAGPADVHDAAPQPKIEKQILVPQAVEGLSENGTVAVSAETASDLAETKKMSMHFAQPSSKGASVASLNAPESPTSGDDLRPSSGASALEEGREKDSSRTVVLGEDIPFHKLTADVADQRGVVAAAKYFGYSLLATLVLTVVYWARQRRSSSP